MKRIALVGNFPPRKCGIATFMNDLNDGIRENGIETSVVAMNDGVRVYDYPDVVEFQIEQDDIHSYIQAAGFLNTHGFDAVVLQHEFGIFGGTDGHHIIQLLKHLNIPVITTFHTILDEPSEGQRAVVNEIAAYSKRLVSISQKGIHILNKTYGIPVSKCRHIHHGVHPTNGIDTDSLRRLLDIENKKVLLTFGLLSRNKSLEVVINALPEIVRKHPEVVYIILGATHPNVVKNDGEEYRESLIRLTDSLGLKDHVIFIDQFVSNPELFRFLKMCDIYVIPYQGEKQISSGTLIYAMGAGKPVISTPFWYAGEMLAEERGILFDFNDSDQLTKSIVYLLDHEHERETMARNALNLAEQCHWPHIGRQYIELIKKVISKEKQAHDRNEKSEETVYNLPPVHLHHLRVLTDHTGILQHARYAVPDPAHGYCIDDNARALMLCVMMENNRQMREEVKDLSDIYLSFVERAWNPGNSRFRNFMSYDREWLEEEGSEDSIGRTMWALGYTARYTGRKDLYQSSVELFRKGLKNTHHLSHPRSLAYLLMGLTHYVSRHPDRSLNEMMRNTAGRLSGLFDQTSACEDWPWCDSILTYGNSRIPQALIIAGNHLKDPGLMERGLGLLDWLIEKQFINDIFAPVGNNGWMLRESRALFDQQPLEAHGMTDACLTAEEFMKDGRYASYAQKAFDWFTGRNLCSLTIYDEATGGCRDGLHADRVNLNQGAESTLSWLMSLVTMHNFSREKIKSTSRQKSKLAAI